MNRLVIIKSIQITEENKVRLRNIINEVEALEAIPDADDKFILNGTKCVEKS